MIEIQTGEDPQNVEGIIKPEILRIEHLYQSKWAKEFLESIGAEDKKLVNFFIDEYRKALEEDNAFNYKVLASKELYNLTKTHISKKWENRKTLDIAEGKFFVGTSSSLKKDEVQIEMIKKEFMEAKEAVKTSKAKLKWLEMESHAYTNFLIRRGHHMDGVDDRCDHHFVEHNKRTSRVLHEPCLREISYFARWIHPTTFLSIREEASNALSHCSHTAWINRVADCRRSSVLPVCTHYDVYLRQ
ncbi:unnamed protein product [Trichobilharzia szidati]|nr:unnamed protein product [Trichobilharzia szidati]